MLVMMIRMAAVDALEFFLFGIRVFETAIHWLHSHVFQFGKMPGIGEAFLSKANLCSPIGEIPSQESGQSKKKEKEKNNGFPNQNGFPKKRFSKKNGFPTKNWLVTNSTETF